MIQHRVIHLITKLEVPPEKILCLTFTEKAAEEMRSRIEDALAKADLKGRPNVATFHSFCDKLLREFPVEADLPRDFRILEGPRLLRFIMKRIDSFNLRYFRIRRSAIEFAEELERFASRCHDEMLSTDEAFARARRIGEEAATEEARQQARLFLELAECKRMLEEELEDGHFATYGELITRTVALLEAHPEVRAKLQERFLHLLVDEFQDDNFAQGRLVSLLARPSGRVTVVGDDDQSIYRFRGAHPKILREFEDAWRPHGLKKVFLKQSYRSTPSIVAMSGSLIAKSPAHDKGKVILPAEGKDGPPVRVVRTPDSNRQAAYIAERIEAARRAGVPLRKVAVLFRSMGHSQAVVRAVERAGIPAEVVGAGGLFDRREVRDALAWASFSANPLKDDLAAFRVLWSPETGLDPVDVARVTRAASEARKPVFEFVRDPTKVPDLSVDAKARLSDLAGRVEKFQPEAREYPAGEALARVIDFARLKVRLNPDLPEGRRSTKNLALLMELADHVAADSDHPGLEEFVELVTLMAREGLDLPEAEPDLEEESVKIMTVHQAKGKEFDLVLVPDLIDRRFPPAARGGLVDDFFVGLHHPETPEGAREDEERRLLYVAMTRAALALELVTFEEHGSGRHAYPSPYLEELGNKDGRAPGAIAPHLEVAEWAPLLEAPEEEPLLPLTPTIEELQRDALGVLTAPLPKDAAAARKHIAALLARFRAAHTREGEVPAAVREALAPLEAALGPLEVLSPRERAPVHHARPGVKKGVLELSYSQLNNYERCPRQYMYGNVLNLRGRQTRYALSGNVIHQVLEQFYKSFKHAKDAKLDDLLALYDAAFASAEFDSELERRQHREDGQAMMEAFFAEESKRTTEPVRLEQWFEFDLGTVKVRGRIDRIDRHPDGRFEVIDYKTGRVESRKAYATENLQLPIYAIAMQEHLKLPLKAATIYALKERKRITLNLGEDLTPSAIESAKRRILEIAAHIREGQFEPKPEPNICAFCEFRMLCPASEAK